MTRFRLLMPIAALVSCMAALGKSVSTAATSFTVAISRLIEPVLQSAFTGQAHFHLLPTTPRSFIETRRMRLG